MPPTINNPPVSTDPGKDIDTGTGGFSIDGKRTTYDVGVEDDGRGERVNWTSGQIKVDNSNQDLSTSTRRTLASYLSKTTLGNTDSAPSMVKNSYPVYQSEEEDPQLISLKDSSGYPTRPGPSSNTAKHVGETLLSSRSDAAVNLNILRGKQKPNDKLNVDGNTLLKNATKSLEGRPTNPSAVGGTLPKIQSTDLDPKSPIGNYYGSPKVSNSVIFNRFNPEGSKYEEAGAGLRDFQFASRYEKGTSVADRDMSHGRLAQIGSALSIRAGLELTSTQQGNNPTDNATTAAAILPGAAQLGIMRIDRDTLTARDVLNSGLDEAIDTDLLIDPAAKSWGTLNNVLDQYAGVTNFGMQLLAVALVVALGIAVALFMNLFPKGKLLYEKFDVNGVRPWGASVVDPQRSTGGGVSEIKKLLSGDLNIWSMLGIRPTVNEFEECLAVGALQFFGIEGTAKNAAELAKAFALEGPVPASQNPGFYAVMARSFNRSFLLLTDYFVGLVKAFGAGVVAGLQQLFSIIDALRSSKFIRFLDTFGQLGDKNLGNKEGFDGIKSGVGKKFVSNIDTASLTAAGTGRIKGSLTQSKSAWTARDLLLMPPNFRTQKLDGPVFESTYQSYVTGSTGRIASEIRQQMEQELESEYVPFYMHDVRTNEILSFHAFLTSLSDDYSASYDATEAFGRVEPIKTYKGTTRKIAFSFVLAAFSRDDFDVMWSKINKLTSMVYPQFTEGRKLVSSDGANAVYAPFSQSISAAPLVRVRIGDLIKSNYSKFGLARLFGLYYEDTKLNNYKTTGKEPQLSRSDAEKRFLSPGNTYRPQGSLDLLGESVELALGYVLKIKNIKDNTATCTLERGTGDDTPTETNEKLDEFNAELQIAVDRLSPSKETEKRILSEIKKTEAPENSSYDDQVDKFMIDNDPNNGNAIARSFRTVGGKGLPGFIESLAFDWYDKTTWTTDEGEGRKAPKMCKVTISFSPFHDITPGLDHKGFNRAPVYPVGPLATKKV